MQPLRVLDLKVMSHMAATEGRSTGRPMFSHSSTTERMQLAADRVSVTTFQHFPDPWLQKRACF